MLMLDSHWMPFSTPETAEATNATVSTAMMSDQQTGADLVHPAQLRESAADLQGAEAQRGGGAEERWRRSPGCRWPGRRAPLACFSPMSGVKTALIVCRRPRRKVL